MTYFLDSIYEHKGRVQYEDQIQHNGQHRTKDRQADSNDG